MQFTIIEKEEQRLDAALPKGRLEERPPAELLDAAQAWSRAVWQAAKQLGPINLSSIQITQGLALADNPIFIVGVHRSGTTLVRNLLDGHPSLVVLPSEGTYYTNLERKLLALPAHERSAFLGMEWLRRLANPINSRLIGFWAEAQVKHPLTWILRGTYWHGGRCWKRTGKPNGRTLPLFLPMPVARIICPRNIGWIKHLLMSAFYNA